MSEGWTPSAETTVADSRASGSKRDAPRVDAGQKLGRYVVIERIGAGGMGVVYACYDPKLDRKLAVKLLSAFGNDDATQADSRASLLSEARAMARLSHPNVIAVHDVGELGDDVFVAMEFIDGWTLREWRQRESPDWRRVIEVFCAAGRGLQAAHAAGLVHRDFKPDNVMIHRDGRVVVMDFGLAMEAERASPTELDERAETEVIGGETESRARAVGTPAYMSPEQHLSLPADARSDQFGFCVALYESLYGRHPFPAESVYQLTVAVTAGELQPPPRDSPVPRRVEQAVMRGLAVDPADRWPSIDALTNELSGSPKRRRQWLLPSSVLAAGLGGAGLAIGMSSHAEPCAQVRDSIDEAWNADRTARISRAFDQRPEGYAGALWSNLEGTLGAYAAEIGRQREDACLATRVRGEQSQRMFDLRTACLARASGRFDSLLEVFGQPDEDVVANAATAVARLPRLALCSDTEGLLAAVPPPEDPETAHAVEQLRERIDRMTTLFDTGQFKAVVEPTRELVSEAEALGYPAATAEAQLLLGETYSELSHEDTYSTLEAAYFSARKADHAPIAFWSSTTLSFEDYRSSHFERGQRWLRHAEAELDEGDPKQRMRLIQTRGTLLSGQGDYDEAIEEFRAALELAEREFGPNAIETADALHPLGLELSAKGEREEAEKLLKRGLEIVAEMLGPDHPDATFYYQSLGTLYEHETKLDLAIENHERALEIALGAFDDQHPRVANAYNELGLVYTQKGDFEKALEYHQNALAIRAKGPPSLEAAASYNNIGFVHTNREDHAAAIDPYAKSLEIQIAVVGPDHPSNVFPHLGLLRSYLAVGRAAEAIEHGEKGLALCRDHGMRATLTSTYEFELARALWDGGGDRRRARELALAAKKVFDEHAQTHGDTKAEVDAWLADH